MIGLESQAARKADTILFLSFTKKQTQLAFFTLLFIQSQTEENRLLHIAAIKIEAILHLSQQLLWWT